MVARTVLQQPEAVALGRLCGGPINGFKFSCYGLVTLSQYDVEQSSACHL